MRAKSISYVLSKIEWPIATAVVVGVGRGHDSKVLLAHVHDVVCIDPHPSVAFPYGCRFVRAAIGRENGSATICVPPSHWTASSTHDQIMPRVGKSIEVKQYCLDHLAGLGVLPIVEGLLWLDCKGCELAALSGGDGWIRQSVNAIFFADVVEASRADGYPCYSRIAEAARFLGFEEHYVARSSRRQSFRALWRRA